MTVNRTFATNTSSINNISTTTTTTTTTTTNNNNNNNITAVGKIITILFELYSMRFE